MIGRLNLEEQPLVRLLLKRLRLEPPQPLIRPEQALVDDSLAGLTCHIGGNGVHASALHKFCEGHKADCTRDAAQPLDAALFDASVLGSVKELGALYDFFHTALPNIKPNGRLIVVAKNPLSLKNPQALACSHSLQGFIRSLAKEVGRKAITAHLIYADDGERDRTGLFGLCQFLLTPRSAFLTGQVFHISSAAIPAHVEISASLEGKTALITGAGSGIGYATAQALLQYGAAIVAVDLPHNAAKLEELGKAPRVTVVTADISATDTPAKLATLAEKNGGLDIVIHNAGITRDRTLKKMAREDWEQVLNVNFAAINRIDDAFLTRNVINNEGRLLYTSSISGLAGNFGQTNYATAKSALVGYVKALACRLAPQQITVNALAPGFIDTAMTRQIPLVTREVGKRLSALGQGGKPQDVAETTCFLASTLGAGLTGSVIRVCGGSYLGA